jgi:hypothetical protein
VFFQSRAQLLLKIEDDIAELSFAVAWSRICEINMKVSKTPEFVSLTFTTYLLYADSWLGQCCDLV